MGYSMDNFRKPEQFRGLPNIPAMQINSRRRENIKEDFDLWEKEYQGLPTETLRLYDGEKDFE